MKTNFFENLLALDTPGNWTMSVEVPTDGTLKVSALYRPTNCGDQAHKLVPPLLLTGTAAELDDGFFGTITEPVKKASGLFVDMESYLKGLEKAKVNSKMISDQKNKPRNSGETGAAIEVGDNPVPQLPAGPTKEERKKAYDDAMKQVEELKGRMKYEEALALLPSMADYPEKEQELKKLGQDLARFKDQMALFQQD